MKKGKLKFKILTTYLIHVVSHSVTWAMFKGFIFKVKFNFVFTVLRFNNIKVNFDCSFWDRFVTFRLTEFNFITIFKNRY